MRTIIEVLQSLFCIKDSCNCYLFKDGRNAIVVDCGDGKVLKHIRELGVKKIQWVLFTHHRDICQGAHKLIRNGVKIAVPEYGKISF